MSNNKKILIFVSFIHMNAYRTKTTCSMRMECPKKVSQIIGKGKKVFTVLDLRDEDC